jgi:hypothetical protein
VSSESQSAPVVIRENATPDKQSQLVQVDAEGRLNYEAYNEQGDIIPDFSYVGYKYGLEAIPQVPVAITLEAVAGDNHTAIQAAIDEVSALPLQTNGFRGAILLKAGRYEVGDTLRISTSGVVLRGEGDIDGTTLVATKPEKHDFIVIGGTGKRTTLRSNQTTITDNYVNVGALSFHVKEPQNLKIGSRVLVVRPSTENWIHAIGMDQIPPRPDGLPVEQWNPGDFDLKFDRTITAIDGDRVTINAPLTNAFQQEFGGGRVIHYKFPDRINNVGVEHLRLESIYDPEETYSATLSGFYTEDNIPCDEDHAWKAITFDNVEHAWAQYVTSEHFAFGCVEMKRESKNITVSHCNSLDPISQIRGGRRYGFNIVGQLCLVRDSFSRKGRHDFAAGSRLPGPNAFVNCRSENSYSTSEPHHRWAAGVLWDNVSLRGPYTWLMANNRGWLGSGHGWAGAQIVFWNCSAPIIGVSKPPTAQNFAIGVTEVPENKALVAVAVRNMNDMSGKELEANLPFWGDGYTESPDGPVYPQSLFEAQLSNRQQQ